MISKYDDLIERLRERIDAALRAPINPVRED
jgi:hypothetical protein